MKTNVTIVLVIFLAMAAGSMLLSPFLSPVPSVSSHHAIPRPTVHSSLLLPLQQSNNPAPPSDPVKLIFIHHSTGENWLADENGGLGPALQANNYFVSDTYYGWTVNGDAIGDRTDIGNWWEWFRGSNSETYLQALYTESDQMTSYSRMATNPGGENEIIMFKSCFPNSHLSGNPDDPPTSGENPMRGVDYGSAPEAYTVANAKGIYNDLLVYFAAHPEKLFIVITSPPLWEGETNATEAANARALSNWLVNDWLMSYAGSNVAVFDFYNVLTSNGGDSDTHDIGSESGNHHRWRNNAIQHTHPLNNNFSAYAYEGDSHPTAAGGQKATAEFIPLLNIFYHRWQQNTPDGTPTLTATSAPIATLTSTPTSTPQDSLPTSTPGGPQPLPTLYLPLIIRGEKTATAPTATLDTTITPMLTPTSGTSPTTTPSLPTPTPTHTPETTPSQRIEPADFSYLGAFRLPDDGERPRTFAYGGNALTFNPNGDADGADDGFPGSLFITGHDRLPYGDLPDGNQVAEISIPPLVASKNLESLNTGTFLQGFHNIAEGYFSAYEEIPQVGMQYLDTATTGPRIHLAWGQHFHHEDSSGPTHAWFSPDLANPAVQGFWYIGNQSLYSVSDYLLEIPSAWADTHAQGRYLGTGRFRDGGMSGMGPALFAYRPWIDEAGTPAASGTHLEETVLLLYERSTNTDAIERALTGYQHPDEWEGAAWLTTTSGKAAVLFAGTKGTGEKYWYGFINADGPEPCVHAESVGEFPVCRLADGSFCPEEDLIQCDNPASGRGWWSGRFDAQFLLYDPTDLAQVAAGTMDSWGPQPYASLDIDEHLFLNPVGIDEAMLGTGDQRRFRINAAAFDRQHGVLYVLEQYADEAKPVVHGWRVE